MYPSGADAGSEVIVNQKQHQPSRPRGPAALIQNGLASASTSSVEEQASAAKPYIALLQYKGEWKRLIDDIIDFAANKLENPGQPQGPILEQALRLVWYELEIDGSTSQDELQRWLVSPTGNPGQNKSIFGFTKGHNGGLRALVGKRSTKYSTRSPFFLAAMGSTCKQGNFNGNQKRERTTLTLGRRRSKKRGLTVLKAIDSEGCFASFYRKGKGVIYLTNNKKGGEIGVN